MTKKILNVLRIVEAVLESTSWVRDSAGYIALEDVRSKIAEHRSPDWRTAQSLFEELREQQARFTGHCPAPCGASLTRDVIEHHQNCLWPMITFALGTDTAADESPARERGRS